MASSHGENVHPALSDEKLELSGKASTLAIGLLVVGVVAILAALGLALTGADGQRRFYHAYLTNYAYVLSRALGGLFFVLVQHLVRSGWSVSVRRVAEAMASTLPFMGLLAIPLAVSVWANKGELYPWAMPTPDHPVPSAAHRAEAIDAAARGTSEHGGVHGEAPSKGITPLTMGKLVWLNPTFWTARVVFYFVFWSAVAVWYWRASRRQDASGEPEISNRLAVASAPLLVVYGLTVTFAAFDLIMSLDPDWYSTIFGVYYFAGCAGGMFASLILAVHLLQRFGYLQQSVNKEHYHDLGKFLFAFTFFWGYIAFSQYMLIWYANIPETTYWFANRGATTNEDTQVTAWGWSIVSLLLLFGRLLIPFAGLLSRHVKRNRGSLIFWAAWILVFHWVDLFWVVMPEFSRSVALGAVEVLCLVGLGGVFVGALIWRLSLAPLRPVRDPRLPESLAFQNF